MVAMKKKDLEFFEALLNERRDELVRELSDFEANNLHKSSRDSSGDISGVSFHPADQASDTIDVEQAFRLAGREGKYLNFIEEALYKIREGTYGICVGCQKLIPRARLEAVPTAKMCIDCKTKKDVDKPQE